MRQSLSITIAANFQSFSTLPASSSSLILSVITCKMGTREKNILLSLSLMFALLPLRQIFIIWHPYNLSVVVYVYNLLIDFGLWHSQDEKCTDCKGEHWKTLSVLSLFCHLYLLENETEFSMQRLG